MDSNKFYQWNIAELFDHALENELIPSDAEVENYDRMELLEIIVN